MSEMSPQYVYDPTPNASTWSPLRYPTNRFLINNYWWSPLCRGPFDAAVERKLDERIGYGMEYAVLVYTGRKLAEFRFDLVLVTEADWAYWQRFRSIIHAVPGHIMTAASTARSLAIWHPQLYPLGIVQCVVAKEPQEVIQDDMTGIVSVQFKQTVPLPIPGYAKPEAAQQQPPADPLEAQNAALTKELQDLTSASNVNRAAGGT